MAKAMEDYPDSCAVLVRRHGIYVWVIFNIHIFFLIPI